MKRVTGMCIAALAAGLWGCAAGQSQRTPRVEAKAVSQVRHQDGKVWIVGVDKYRVTDPMFESVRIALAARGDVYSPAYIQGISGSAFRIGGICPCAPTSAMWMGPAELVRLLGYECEPISVPSGKPEGLSAATGEAVRRIREEIDAGRAVVVFHAFTSAEFDVVYGYDARAGQFLGRSSYHGNDRAYAAADEKRMCACADLVPASVVLIGRKTGRLDQRDRLLWEIGRERVRKKAGVLSLVYPGLGHIYTGRIAYGVFWAALLPLSPGLVLNVGSGITFGHGLLLIEAGAIWWMAYVDARRGPREAPAPCESACPAHIRVPDYIALVREGRPLEALALVHDKLPFAAFCGRACPHPCEQKCVRNEFGAPISIMAIKRYAADLGYAARIPPSFGESGGGRGPRVAIIGAGASGLSAADTLARLGGLVTVFDPYGEPGGMMRYGAPEFRFPGDALLADLLPRPALHAGARLLHQTTSPRRELNDLLIHATFFGYYKFNRKIFLFMRSRRVETVPCQLEAGQLNNIPVNLLDRRDWFAECLGAFAEIEGHQQLPTRL